MSQSTRPPSLQAVVLAGSRPSGDPVARHAGVSHKALVPIAGKAMVARVIDALRASGLVSRIAVVIEDPELLRTVPDVGALIDDGAIVAIESAETPARSASKAVAALDGAYPVLLTTADHALLTPQMVAGFVEQAAGTGADVVAALASQQTIAAAYPDTDRTYLRFRDGRYSGCNLFFLAGPAAQHALRFWQRVEENRKAPWRIAGAIGPGTVILYLMGVLKLEQGLRRLSRAMHATGAVAILAIAEAAIDVDKPADLDLVERILADRGG